MFYRVSIIGLGLIGGSIGLALHYAKASQRIMGYDPDKRIAQLILHDRNLIQTFNKSKLLREQWQAAQDANQ